MRSCFSRSAIASRRPINSRNGKRATNSKRSATNRLASNNVIRCAWCGDDPLYVRYHDEEWGVPCHDDRHLFEMLNLEGAQAGLSWITILRKRPEYRKAFDRFDAKKIARYDKRKINALLKNEGLVRNRLKIEGTVKNAKAFLAVKNDFGTFDQFIWQFNEASAMSKALK